MKKTLRLFLLAIAFSGSVYSQNVGINSDGSAPATSAMLDVTSTTKGFLPPRVTTAQMLAISSPAEGLMVYNSDLKTPAFYNGTDWCKSNGDVIVYVGKAYQGGVVAYIFESGDAGYVAGETHGLIATTADQGTAIWGCFTVNVSGAEGSAIGTGAQNTIDILAGCATLGIGARVCDDYTSGAYTDWYLPSINELAKLYLNRTAIGGFSTNGYLSSTEYTGLESTQINIIQFVNGAPGLTNKGTAKYIRPIRTF